MENIDIDFDTTLTVDEFIDLCRNDYGGEIIKQLEERWGDI